MSPQAEERRKNHSRVPVIRSQVRAFRKIAETTYRTLDDTAIGDGSGVILAASVNAGLALELGLKIFYMTFHEKAAWGHDLVKLFRDLPEQIQGDIRESYSASLAVSRLPPTRVMALRISKEQPTVPENVRGRDIGTAQGLIEEASDAFERGRYFFDRVGEDDWAIIGYPINHMLLMSRVLDVVYDEYIRRGSWS